MVWFAPSRGQDANRVLCEPRHTQLGSDKLSVTRHPDRFLVDQRVFLKLGVEVSSTRSCQVSARRPAHDKPWHLWTLGQRLTQRLNNVRPLEQVIMVIVDTPTGRVFKNKPSVFNVVSVAYETTLRPRTKRVSTLIEEGDYLFHDALMGSHSATPVTRARSSTGILPFAISTGSAA